ncbi:ERF family protein [Methanoculleus sp.]|uniref:ERF family protein n=1 Tax=Methanoculleus sp. TaxID=90427 RepID=UPI0025D7BE91|nr:ERF family protein [Methanoculleus sp.]MCK9320248.1 ERF family protein [Methanoculleus sp.]
METKDVSKMNIYQKLLAISTEVNRVAKNLSVKAGGETYKAVGEGDVLAAVKPLEDSYNVYSYPVSREITESGIHETKSGTKMLFMREKVVYRFVNTDNPSEFVDMESIGDGMDTQDKAPGKATTYADKYALLKAYKIQTGDDPDKDGSEDMKSNTVYKTTYEGKGKAENKPQENSAGIPVKKYGALKDLCGEYDMDFNKVADRVATKYNKKINELSDEEWTYITNQIKGVQNAEVQMQ